MHKISNYLILPGLILFLNLEPIIAQNISSEKQFVLDWLSQPKAVEKFGKISDAIWSYAELGLQEFKSSKLLADNLEKAGFRVERGLAGMPTCFVATYGSGKPVIGFTGEFDALPMISQKAMTPRQEPLVNGAPGHGCGHNTMCTAASAAAIAVKEAMDKYGIKGTIKVFGSPAEEMLVSRPYMIRAGLFEGVDAIIDNHAATEFTTEYGLWCSALYSVIFTFKGRTAHSAYPSAGRSALDAVEIMNVSTNFLREHLDFMSRMHYVIIEGGQGPNVVPDRASVWYYIRNDDNKVEDMYRRVVLCAKGAAMATETTIDTIRVLTAIHQAHLSKACAELIHKNVKLVGMPEWTEEEQQFAKALQKELGRNQNGLKTEIDPIIEPEIVFTGGASTDLGEVTLLAPTACVSTPTIVPGTTGHHWSTVTCLKGSIAWKGLNAGAKVIAATAVDLLTKPEELKKLRDEFEAYSKKHPYKSFLPEGATPPLDLNMELMNKYRPLMEPNYSKPF